MQTQNVVRWQPILSLIVNMILYMFMYIPLEGYCYAQYLLIKRVCLLPCLIQIYLVDVFIASSCCVHVHALPVFALHDVRVEINVVAF